MKLKDSEYGVVFCAYIPFLLYSQSTEEKLEKRLEEAKVLETSALLELKRLGQEIFYDNCRN